MSSLTATEKSKLEKIFKMSGGYVLGFSDKSLNSFLLDIAGLDLTEEKYKADGSSKANRLRAFWRLESDQTVSRVTQEMLKLVPDYWTYRRDVLSEEVPADEEGALEESSLTVERLLGGSDVEHLDAIESNADDKDFRLLAKLIREAIENGQPEAGLDRLHTYIVKYIRFLCRKHNLTYDIMNAPLHAVFGMYVKHLRQKGFIKSEMTDYLLKSSIKTLESFNHVRNKLTLAHDNPLLDYHESMFIFKSITNLVKLIESIEQQEAVV